MAIWPFAKKRRTDDASREVDTGPMRGKTPTRVYSGNHTDILVARDSQMKRRQAGRNGASDGQDPERTFQYPSAALDEKSSPPSSSPVQSSVPNLNEVLADSVGKNTNLGIFTENRGDVPSYYFQNPASHTTLSLEQRQSWQRPTLASRVGSNDPTLARRKSSKKDKAREAQIKRLSAPGSTSSRPATHSGNPLQRDNKKMRSGLNRSLHRPMSDISLPIPESMESTMSLASDQQPFRVRTFDILSPRPTIRRPEGTRSSAGLRSWEPSRSNSRREKRPFLSEETLNQSNRIDELADDLDAGALRELMERDQRRREKKRRTDEEKMQRKLQRRAEKQREEEEQGGPRTPRPSRTMDNQREMLDAPNLAQNQTFAARGERQLARSLDEREGMLIEPSWLHDPSREQLQINPFADAEEASGPSTRDPTPAEELEEPVIATAQAVRLSQASTSPPTSPRYRTVQSVIAENPPNNRDSATEYLQPSESDQRFSGSSGGRQPTVGSWTSIFRRSGSKAKHSSADSGPLTPSDFSNTSRDSLSRQFPPVPTQNIGFAKRAVPMSRTISKFREDLPELPTPPDSRVQSLEPAPPSAQMQEARSPDLVSASLAERISVGPSSPTAYDPFADPSMKARNETPISGHRSSEAPSLDGKAPSTVVSQSMASIDSEGSWLSGRKGKRGSQGPGQLRHSASSLQKRFNDFSDSGDELGVTEDEYFSRLTPSHDHTVADHTAGAARKNSVAMASTDGEDDRAEASEHRSRYGTVGRKPTVVQQEALNKSREGLLNEDQGGEQSNPTLSPDLPESGKRSFEFPPEESSTVQQGVTHVRRISAGSARLLDIKTRADQKRHSGGSVTEGTQE